MASLAHNELQEELVISLVIKRVQTPFQKKGIHQVRVSHIFVPSLDRSSPACQFVKVVVGVLAALLGELL